MGYLSIRGTSWSSHRLGEFIEGDFDKERQNKCRVLNAIHTLDQNTIKQIGGINISNPIEWMILFKL